MESNVAEYKHGNVDAELKKNAHYIKGKVSEQSNACEEEN